MNDQTLQMLQRLADKLGTTTEMLWGVLLKQTLIEGAACAVYIAVFSALSIIALRFVIKKTTPVKRYPDDRYPTAEWSEEGAFFSWAAWAIFTVISTFIVCESTSELVTIIFNPEYWALKQILSVLK